MFHGRFTTVVFSFVERKILLITCLLVLMPFFICIARNKTAIATFGCESEYIEILFFAKQLSWIRNLFWETANKEPKLEDERKIERTKLFIDRYYTTALTINKQPWMKHISLKFHFVKHSISCGEFSLWKIPKAEHVDKNPWFFHYDSLMCPNWSFLILICLSFLLGCSIYQAFMFFVSFAFFPLFLFSIVIYRQYSSYPNSHLYICEPVERKLRMIQLYISITDVFMRLFSYRAQDDRISRDPEETFII